MSIAIRKAESSTTLSTQPLVAWLAKKHNPAQSNEDDECNTPPLKFQRRYPQAEAI
jgi:hypothetical protein